MLKSRACRVPESLKGKWSITPLLGQILHLLPLFSVCKAPFKILLQMPKILHLRSTMVFQALNNPPANQAHHCRQLLCLGNLSNPGLTCAIQG